jgi:NAD(P)-dependent dehydrogenase (short-subunit alcohol dehydrogenase family)
MGMLDGQIALVFGASNAGNMGVATARRYAREGARVILAGRNVAGLQELGESIGAEIFPCDIGEQQQVIELAARLQKRFGTLDTVMNAVGVHHHAKLADISSEGLDALMRAHYSGPIYLFKHLAPLVRRGGAMIMVTSVAAQSNNNPPGVGVYGASKAATNKLVRVAAIEYGAAGIRINAIAPGLVMTPMGRNSMKSLGTVLELRMINRTPLGRLATTDDIAAAAVFLASKDCFMTGQILQVSGGFDLFDAGVPANTIDTVAP